MKTKILLLFVLLSLNVRPDYTITRGPNPGEIYFIGLTNTGVGIYYSTDYGETATCQDYESYFYGSICADKTEGVLYLRDFFSALYVSYNYGLTNSWELVNGGVKEQLNSGRVEGEIYSSFSKHSEDFGQTFINHLFNGFFGNKKDVTIDEYYPNIGYVVTASNDSIYLLISYDWFENLEIKNVFDFSPGNFYSISRGSNTGELFLYNNTKKRLYFSENYGNDWVLNNSFNFSTIYNFGLTGGRTDGEFYLVYDFVNMAWQNAHTYIFHSLDYGKTFEVFHPFAKGSEPVLANFSTIDKEVHLSTPIEFSNFSIGDIQEYQWDFQNDGIIDSYEQNPTYVYQDTGWYSVKLSVVGADSTNSFVKEDYIHIIDTTTFIKEDNNNITISPNPFDNELYVNFNKEKTNFKITVYNLQGKIVQKQKVKQIKTFKLSFSNFPSGIYLLSITDEDQSTNYKIIKN